VRELQAGAAADGEEAIRAAVLAAQQEAASAAEAAIAQAKAEAVAAMAEREAAFSAEQDEMFSTIAKLEEENEALKAAAS